MSNTATPLDDRGALVETEERRTLLERVVRRGYMAWNAMNEIYLNIETERHGTGPGGRLPAPGLRGLHSDRARFHDNVRYVPLDYVRIRRMLEVLDPGIDDVLYDIGAGKGRILCAASRRRMKRVVGIELFEELCVAARENAARVRGRRTTVDVICADATAVDYSDATIITMFLPFGEATTRAMLQVIRDSLITTPRDIRIAYAHPLHETVFEEASWLEKYAAFRNTDMTHRFFWRSVSFWRNRAVL